jgi:hypothetical protein
MTKNHKMYCKSTILFALLFGLLFIPVSAALATEVDRTSFYLESYPGETIDMEITLTGTSPEERSGFWHTHYKEVEGDSNKMDITSWITIEPENYVIKQGEIKSFTVKVKIPKDAEPGLWGAISEEAGKPGHSDDRRTYIIFKDANTGGNVYSGLLLPVAVNVLKSPNSLAPVINFVEQNIMTITLSVVIIVLLAMLLLKRGKLPKKNLPKKNQRKLREQ